MSGNFKYGFNIIVAFVLAIICGALFDLDIKETILYASILAILYNQNDILRSLENA